MIILRGPPGSGKSIISEALQEHLGKHKTFLLNLDERRTFDSHLMEALDPKYEHVVGEMNHGNSHTEEPEEWVSKFKEKGYAILSVILLSSLNYCLENARNRLTNPLSEDEMRFEYNKFYHNLLTVFAHKAQVKEICIDCEHKEKTEIVKEIAESVQELKTA